LVVHFPRIGINISVLMSSVQRDGIKN